ncbi:MAG TPA: TIGR02266 family protein, partial [Polyangiaceae bacterium]
MIPDTRKDPRAKVLSMTVRYKSATIDEFIEHHSHDVSRGGMFIKTPSPFPPGTLLKFEVRIADEQKVMQGVGRVVWKREASSAAVDSPSGMGVKFIKLDDDSKGIIDRLVGKRGTAEGAYDAGERISAQGGRSGPDAPTPAGGTPAVEKPIPMRKGTMIGLGAVKLPEAGAKAGGGGGAFFPDSEPLNQPAPEDRTVMRQAAELLRDALREAGGSMEEIGTAGAAPLTGTEAKAAATPALKPSEPPAAKTPEKKIEPAAARSERPAAKPTASRPSSEPSRDSVPVSKPSGGSKSAVWMVLGVIVIGAG